MKKKIKKTQGNRGWEADAVEERVERGSGGLRLHENFWLWMDDSFLVYYSTVRALLPLHHHICKSLRRIDRTEADIQRNEHTNYA
jgi:hypothetical protein